MIVSAVVCHFHNSNAATFKESYDAIYHAGKHCLAIINLTQLVLTNETSTLKNVFFIFRWLFFEACAGKHNARDQDSNHQPSGLKSNMLTNTPLCLQNLERFFQ